MDLSGSHSMAGQHVMHWLLGSRELSAQHHPHPAQGRWHTLPIWDSTEWGAALHCLPASALPGHSMPIQQVLTWLLPLRFYILVSWASQYNTAHRGQNALHSYWHGYSLLLKVNSRQRCSSWNFGRCVVFVTRAVHATILKSVLKENSVKTGKCWKKLFFSVVKVAQYLESFKDDIQKPCDLQAVYSRSLE